MEDLKFNCRVEDYKVRVSEILCHIFYFDRAESVSTAGGSNPQTVNLNMTGKTMSSKYSNSTKRLLQTPHFEFAFDKQNHMMVGGEKMTQMMTLNSRKIEEEEDDKNASENENLSPNNGKPKKSFFLFEKENYC